jgi:hypothetical protein
LLLASNFNLNFTWPLLTDYELKGGKMAFKKSRITKVLTFLSVLLIGLASPVWCAQSDYDGYYAGTFSGDDNGVWIAVIDSSSSTFVFLTYSTDSDDVDLGSLTYVGESGGIGNYFTASTEIFGSTIDADIDSSDGSVSGSWNNLPAMGTLTGEKDPVVNFAGNYSGNVAGDDTGTWTIAIAANGATSGSFATSSGSGDVTGIAHPDGYLLAVAEDTINDVTIVMFGRISGSRISGEWEADDNSSGTFSTDSGGGGGGGGGGGCFISTIIN